MPPKNDKKALTLKKQLTFGRVLRKEKWLISPFTDLMKIQKARQVKEKQLVAPSVCAKHWANTTQHSMCGMFTL